MLKDLILLGPEPLALAHPTREEVEAIIKFSHDENNILSIQTIISQRCSRIIADISIFQKEISDIYLYAIQIFDNYIGKYVADYENWSLNSYQPNLFSRAIYFFPEMREYVRLGFGVNMMGYAEIKLGQLPKPDDAIELFLYKAFLNECSIHLKCEKALSPKDLGNFESGLLERDEIDPSSYNIYTHAFIAKIENDKPYHPNGIYQFFASVGKGHLEKFINTLYNNGVQKVLDTDPTKGGWYTVKTNRKYLIERWKNRQKQLFSINIQKSIKKLETITPIYYLGVAADSAGNYADVEREIFNNIVRSSLSDKDTPSENSDENPSRMPEEGIGSLKLSRSLLDQLSLLDRFAAENPGEPVSDFVLKLFPSLLTEFDLSETLPTMAPEIWPSDRREADGKLETPPAFIKRVYAEWEGRGLTKKLVRELDPTLYRALYNWLQRGNQMPDDLDLPTIAEQNDRVIDGLLKQGSERDASSFAAKEIVRVQSALRRRLEKE
jgi:hypothetical protein